MMMLMMMMMMMMVMMMVMMAMMVMMVMMVVGWGVGDGLGVYRVSVQSREMLYLCDPHMDKSTQYPRGGIHDGDDGDGDRHGDGNDDNDDGDDGNGGNYHDNKNDAIWYLCDPHMDKSTQDPRRAIQHHIT
jgi:hypothetical protein